MSAPRVVVVDDHPLVRSGIVGVLEGRGIEVAGEADDGDVVVELAERIRPDVVLMDIRMQRMDGIEATRRLRLLPEPPRVLVLTTFDLDEYVYRALQAGASGFLLKDASPERLVDAIRTVAAGEALLAPAVTRRLIERYLRAPEAAAEPARTFDDLTQRERDIWLHIVRGLSNAEIGAELFLSEATVKAHVTRLLAKLAVRDRVQAVVLAYEAGVVRPGAGPGGPQPVRE
ncbi:response regulator [Microbacterium album]|uniref:DNA-binding response regulator n=1 Tax=Microbacterium album TaxID=2053191 RepID=A0A917MK86_9MICO|nr:response regulator transcription factor [Microbacterium album]GGH33678.1 DNA-binding response regulator [Microbacterium album]